MSCLWSWLLSDTTYSAKNKGQVSQDSQEQETEKIKAPDFTVLDADGNTVKLSELFGKPIVLNF